MSTPADHPSQLPAEPPAGPYGDPGPGPYGDPGPAPGFGLLQLSAPIEELALPYDPAPTADRVRRQRWRVRSGVVSLVVSVAVLVALYVWKRDQLTGAGLLVLYAVLLGVQVARVVVALVQLRRSRRVLAGIGPGTALRIGRRGVELRGVFVGWPEVSALGAVTGRWGRYPELRLVPRTGDPVSLPLDQVDVRPATLDTTARAYSGGRHGVDLAALDA